MKQDRKALGRRGEDAAAALLLQQGFSILARNYRDRWGELDIVAQKEGVLYFVEVRARRAPDCGAAAESVDLRKQAQVRATAERYLARELGKDCECRFLAAAVALDAVGEPSAVELIEDDFC